ncbi:PPC domain-containing DNA-binding protein [Peptoniphilus phoceensis]|uniref:PPC domain-containing DNA-binding protein n=1 Tax=Peptoniphilus phoceensis TaxID=1720298 RepID=UPI0007838EDD|nr:PPC domain-containing DNA-binding protein [Peptoniphilus phoceensis]
MDYKRFDDKIVARIDRTEEVHEKLKEIALKENIKLASVYGLGATDDFTIGIFSVSKKDYKERNFKGEFEILSIIGSISTLDGEYYPHIHISASNGDGNVFGGHMKSAKISVTCELTINIIDGIVDRQKDPKTGINIYKFD